MKSRELLHGTSPPKQVRPLSTSRRKAIESPGRMFAVGAGVARSGDPLGTTTATFGAGVTAGRGLMIPEPAARTPPTIRTAATASNVKPRRPPRARSGTGVVAGIVARTWRRSSGAAWVSPTSAAYQAWRRCSSSWSVMGSSPCRPHRWRRATASMRSGDGTGRSPTGPRDAARCRRRSGRGSSAAPRRPGGPGRAPRSRRR